MARMTAAEAAVEILKKEGVTNVFGLPGAAINPFYKAMQTSGGLHRLHTGGGTLTTAGNLQWWHHGELNFAATASTAASLWPPT